MVYHHHAAAQHQGTIIQQQSEAPGMRAVQPLLASGPKIKQSSNSMCRQRPGTSISSPAAEAGDADKPETGTPAPPVSGDAHLRSPFTTA